MSFDEFRSMVSFAMAVMNDRPLTYVYTDVTSEGIVLTPSLLLNGFNLLEPPHLSIRKSKDNTEISFGERYEIMERLKDSFWNLWSNQYLHELSEKHVRQGKTKESLLVPKIDDIVLIKKENVKRREWKLGRILDVKIGNRDGKIREFKIQTLSDGGKRSVISRSPTFLVPLEVKPESIDTNLHKTNIKSLNKKGRITKKVTFV